MSKTKTLHRWTCPEEETFLLKPETVLLATLVVIIFVFSFALFDQRWYPAVVLTIFFIALFLIVNKLSRRIYPIKEAYHITHQGLTITSKVGKKTTKTHIKFKDIHNFKLDHTFHGGRIETNKKNHPLFFNTRAEIKKLETILKKKIK